MKLALVLVAINGLTSFTLPTIAEWVFNTGESVTYPRSESVGARQGIKRPEQPPAYTLTI